MSDELKLNPETRDAAARVALHYKQSAEASQIDSGAVTTPVLIIDGAIERAVSRAEEAILRKLMDESRERCFDNVGEGIGAEHERQERLEVASRIAGGWNMGERLGGKRDEDFLKLIVSTTFALADTMIDASHRTAGAISDAERIDHIEARVAAARLETELPCRAFVKVVIEEDPNSVSFLLAVRDKRLFREIIGDAIERDEKKESDE